MHLNKLIQFKCLAMLVNDESHKCTLIFTFTTNAFFAQTKIFVYGSFWTTTCTHEPSQDANFDSTEFFTTCLFEVSFQVWSFIIFLFNKYEVSNFYQTAIATSRFKDTFVFSYLISHDSTRYIFSKYSSLFSR